MPNLTTKELTGIEDQLSSEKNLVLKFSMYASSTQDPELKSKLNQISDKHQQHFDTLYSLLG